PDPDRRRRRIAGLRRRGIDCRGLRGDRLGSCPRRMAGLGGTRRGRRAGRRLGQVAAGAPRPPRWLKPAATFLRRLPGSPAVERGLFVARARHWRYTDPSGLSIAATLTTLATSALDVANGSHPGMVRT